MAMFKLLVLLAPLAHAAVLSEQSRELSLEETWSATLDADSKKSPVKRVILLLQQMRNELTAEADKEAEMYDKMVCWCETNEKEKTSGIAQAEGKIGDLMSEIEARAAAKGELATKISAMKGQIAADTASLAKAVALREKGAAEFSSEEKEMMQATTNLKNAVTVLSKHQSSSSLLQLDSPELASVRAVVEDASLKYDMMQGDSGRVVRLGAPKRKSAAALLDLGAHTGMDKAWASVLDTHEASVLPIDIAQRMLAQAAKEAKKDSALLQAAPSGGSYAPQSSAIFGILKQMQDEFEKNLSQSQKDEMQAVSEFQELSATKAAQIAVGKEKLDGLEGDSANNAKALSDAKEDYELTTGKRASDVEFLRTLKLTCQDLDRQWAERSKTRGAEITAVGEALSVLTDDDNREHLAKTVTFVQLVSDSDAASQLRRSNAMAALRTAMQDPSLKTDDLMAAWNQRSMGGSPKTQLATLAVSMQLDTFTKVKELMDKMVADLKNQQSEEVSFKANCGSEFNQNERTTQTKKEEKADLEAKIESLTKLIATLQEETATAKTNIADAEVAIKKASETREGENAEFQTTVADQRATQAILTKALAKLESFYKKKSAALLETKTKAASKQEPPVKFGKLKSNAGSAGVMGLLEQIIEDSAALEKEAVAGEQEAQSSYESFVKESNAVIAQLSDAVTSKSKAVAGSEVELEQSKADLNSTDEEIASLGQFEADLHQQCDFVLKNFSIRQAARLQEIEAINQAKGILSGSDA